MRCRRSLSYCSLTLAALSLGGSLASAQAPIQAPAKSPVQTPVQAPGSLTTTPAPQVVTRTIMVPHTTYKTITVPAVVCKPELRQKTVTVCRSVPHTTFETCLETVLVPQQRFRTETYTACRMTFETVTRNITVMVAHPEQRQGTRTVCRPVQTQEMRTVCRDVGQWATRRYIDCHGCEQSCQAWVPSIVTEQVPVTVWKPQMSEEPYTYTELVCRPEQRQVTEHVAKPVYETKTRDVPYLVSVPKQVERRVPRTTFTQVTEEKTVNYTVQVPHQVERTVRVPVCTMIPQQVSYTIAPGGACSACGW